MRIANERTLELNITHQLLSIYRDSFAVGATQKYESRTGVDSGIQTPYRAIVFQYKASNPRRGADGIEAQFLINNNQKRDQHVKLHGLGKIFTNTVFYGFPLVVSDPYFQVNASSLIPITVFVGLERLPRFSMGDPHRIKVFSNGAYVVSSELHEGRGILGKEFINALRTGEVGIPVSHEKESIVSFIQELDHVCRKVELRQRLIRIAFFHEREPFVYTLRFGWERTRVDESQGRLFQ